MSTTNPLILLITVVAVTANMLFVWPQAIRLIRSRDTSGVSPTTWCISITLFTVFAAYAYHIDYWALFVANVSCLIAAILILFIGTRYGDWGYQWGILSALAVALAITFGAFAPIVLAALMSVAGILLRVPQLVSLLRNPNVTGVSALTWVLSGLTAGCWLIVSIHQHATAVIIANSTALAATIALLAVLYSRKHQQALGTTTS